MCSLRAMHFLMLPFFISSLLNNVYGDDASNGSPIIDLEALIAFKEKITNDTNNCTQNWDGSLINACSWMHLYCDDYYNNTRVTEVYLGDCDIFGELVEDLGKMSVLKTLDLYGNNFFGPIPPSLGNLPNLISLDLSHSLVKGQIPRELGSLTKLRNLKLSGNVIVGNIPPELGSLTSLQRLYLDDNFLEGSIPRELWKLNQLSTLNLSCNNLNGSVPGDLPQILPFVTTVDLTNNTGPGYQVGLAGDCTIFPCCFDGITREPKVCNKTNY